MIVRNLTDSPRWVALQRRWRDALGVGELFANPRFVEALPDAVELGRDVRVYDGVAVRIEGTDKDVLDAQTSAGLPYDRRQPGSGLFVFETPAEAVLAIERIAGSHVRVAMGVGTGPIVEVSGGSRVHHSGDAIVRCDRAVQSIAPGMAALESDSGLDGEAGGPARRRLRLFPREGLPPLIAFAVWLDSTRPPPRPTARRDPRSDLYALGVLLFRTLSGRRPWRGETLGVRASRRVEEDVDSLRWDGVPEPWRPILRRALRRRREERFPDASAFMEAVSRLT